MTDTYEADLAAITSSGPHPITDERRAFNRSVRDGIKDILPINDIHKKSDCDLIYRFLIAHRWNVVAAMDGLRAYVDWREQNRMNEVIWEKFPPEVEAMLPKWSGVDIFGHPVTYDRIDPKLVGVLLQTTDRATMLRAHFSTMEMGRRLCKAMNTDRISVFMDLSLLGASVFTNPAAIGFLKEASHLDQTYYPENMRTMVLCNAGWTFNLLWRVIKPLLDERVQKKVQVFATVTPVDLAKWIPLDQVPKKYGGEADNEPNPPHSCIAEVATLPVGSPLGSAATGTAERGAAAPGCEQEDDFHSVASTAPEDHEELDEVPPAAETAAPPRPQRSSKEIEMLIRKEATAGGPRVFIGEIEGTAFAQTHGHLVVDPRPPFGTLATVVPESGHPMHPHLFVTDGDGIRFIVKKHQFHKALDVFKPAPGTTLKAGDGFKFSASCPDRTHMFDVRLPDGVTDKRDWALFSHTRVADAPLCERQGMFVVFRKELTLLPQATLFALFVAINDLWPFNNTD